jgi:hypothetical protein
MIPSVVSKSSSPARSLQPQGHNQCHGVPNSFKAGAPVVQVISIQSDVYSGISATIQCCYCFKEHRHGVSGQLSSSHDVPECLGHREAVCHTIPGSPNGYNISLLAWKLSGRSIVLPTMSLNRHGPSPNEAEDCDVSCTKKIKAGTTGVVENFTAQFDKFVTVSKIFRDLRYFELQERERILELTVFWKDHNCVKLKDAMAFANQKPDGPDCSCVQCAMSGRKNFQITLPSDGLPCTFMPYFESLLSECNITSKNGHGGVGIEHESTYDSIFDVSTHTYVYDIDTHLVTMGGTGWYLLTYGSKLWKARSIKSIELHNLSLLFKNLYYDGVESDLDSEDVILDSDRDE